MIFKTCGVIRHILIIVLYFFSKRSPWRWSQEWPKHVGVHNTTKLRI